MAEEVVIYMRDGFTPITKNRVNDYFKSRDKLVNSVHGTFLFITNPKKQKIYI